MSKVHSIARAAASVAGTMADIASSGALPIVKDSGHADGKKVATFSDRAEASVLAAQVMARVQGDAQSWRTYAMRLIGYTIEGRAAFVEIIDAQLKEMKSANKLDDAVEAKTAAKRVASATVEVSKLRTIAKAFNAGADIDGLREYAKMMGKCRDLPELGMIGYVLVVEYARTFAKSQAGRTADTFAVKLAKFLDRNRPEESDADGVKLFDNVVNLVNG